MKSKLLSNFFICGILFLGTGPCYVLGANEGASRATTFQQTLDTLPSLSEQQNKSVVGLLQKAAQYLNKGQLAEATATLERALRIEPRNPAIWHYLGQTALYQGRYTQVEALAAKSNSLAGNDEEFRVHNDWLIDAARQAEKQPLVPIFNLEEKRNLEAQLTREIARRHQAKVDSDLLREPLEETDSISFAPSTDRFTTVPRLSEPAIVEPDAVTLWEDQDVNTAERTLEPVEKPIATSIPRGHRPPPGQCRIWFTNRPSGHQPPPGNCFELEAKLTPGSWLVHSDGRYVAQ